MKIFFYSLFFLFAGISNAGNGTEVKVQVLARQSTSWDGRKLPDYPSGSPEISIMRIKIPPGVSLPMHRHPFINAGVLLQGELTVVTENNETLHLQAGDPIVEVVNTWHYGRNEGDEIAEIMVFYAGVEGQSNTISQ